MEIDENIPVPPPRKSLRKYPFAKMEIGNSVLIEGDEKTAERARVAATMYGARTGKRFTCRKEEGGLRIWRVEPESGDVLQ